MDIHNQYLFSFFSAYGPICGMQGGHSSFSDKFRSAQIGGCGGMSLANRAKDSSARTALQNSHGNFPWLRLRNWVSGGGQVQQ
jgi:hypothetical protein